MIVKIQKCPKCGWIVTPKTVKCPNCQTVVITIPKKTPPKEVEVKEEEEPREISPTP